MLLWYRYYVVEKLHVRPPTAHKGTAQATGLWCICAINLMRGGKAPRRVSPNLLAFFDCLKLAGYNLIVVHNGDCPTHLVDMLLPFCHTVLIRPQDRSMWEGIKSPCLRGEHCSPGRNQAGALL